MPSEKAYLDYVLEQLSAADAVTYRLMMGEYVLYYRGKVFGGVYDDRFLVKAVAAARARLPEADLVVPYPGAKEMLSVDPSEGKEFLSELLNAMWDELPAPKQRK